MAVATALAGLAALRTTGDRRVVAEALAVLRKRVGCDTVVTESARAHSYILSQEVQKTDQFWLLS